MNRARVFLGLYLGLQLFTSLPAKSSDDPVPWPFSNPCPLLWHDIEGYWQVTGVLGLSESFLFKIVESEENPSPRIELNHYGRNMNLIGKGTGQFLENENVLQFTMANPNRDNSEEKNYIVLMGKYIEKDKGSCERERVTTILTIKECRRDASIDCRPDIHYIIEKRTKSQTIDSSHEEFRGDGHHGVAI